MQSDGGAFQAEGRSLIVVAARRVDLCPYLFVFMSFESNKGWINIAVPRVGQTTHNVD
jgi:hypothetical protein